MKRYASLIGTAAFSCILVLFFTVYGVHYKLSQSPGGMWRLVEQTLRGIHLRANYYGLSAVEMLYSIRLIVFAILFALVLGSLLALIRVRANSIVKTIIEVPFTLFESIPEPLYIVLTTLVALFFLEHTNFPFPAFPFEAPSWLDTLIPAIALGLPGAFYLSRVLQMNIQDELHAQYVTTAQSKGLTESQAFYRHVISNALPGFIKQVTVICTMVLSSVLFAEFMLGYQGILFKLTEYGFLDIQRPRGVPLYEPGLIFAVGSFLVGMWFLCALACRVWFDARYPNDVETNPAPQLTKIQFSWIIAGGLLLFAVLICAIFPDLVTYNSPNKWYIVDWKTFTSPPFPPGFPRDHPFLLGSDYLGRSLLARALQGTWATLVPAVGGTLVIIVVSLLGSSLATINPSSWLAKCFKFVGGIVSALPVLVILMIVLHTRNMSSPYQELQYILWLVLFESGRGIYSFTQAYEQWFQYGFVEGALSIGRRRISILFVHFRKWLQRFTLEFAFIELSRMLSLMMMLAVFRIYVVETMGFPEFYDTQVPELISAQNSWFSMIGDAVTGGTFMNKEFYLYASALCLLLITVGSNLIARGLRGKFR